MRTRTWLCFCSLIAVWGCQEELYFIPGTATLPDCNETPVTDLNGSLWFDQGTVTIESDGCAGVSVGDELDSCALNWSFSQDGNDVSIVVDEEYQLEGRLCGDQLFLRGGWWLPVRDEDGFCYEDDSAEEVGIQAGGNTLTVSTDPPQMTGVLAVQGSCAANYDATYKPLRDPSRP